MTAHTKSQPTLVELNESSSTLFAFCVHPAGGGLRPYELLARKLVDAAKLYGLEDPCLYADESYSTVPELAELHVDVIRSVQPAGPYMLLGSCSGGPIAYEVACQLSMEGDDAKVVMFGSHGVVGFDPAEREEFLFLRDYLSRRFGLNMDALDWSGFEKRSRSEVCSAIVLALVAQGVVPATADTGWIHKSLASLCMTRAATKTYRAPKSCLDVDLFKQPRPHDVAGQGPREWCDWNNLTKGILRIFEHSPQLGPNDDILAEPYVDETVRQLKRIFLSLSNAAELLPA